MHRGLSMAVVELRTRMQWGQADLAREIRKQGGRANTGTKPNRETISRWEHGQQSPSPEHRMALAKIAMKYKHEDLAQLFRMPMSAWRIVGTVKFGLKNEE